MLLRSRDERGCLDAAGGDWFASERLRIGRGEDMANRVGRRLLLVVEGEGMLAGERHGRRG